MSLLVRPPQLLAEPAWPAMLALPGPFFLYSSALSQGLWCRSRCCVCLDLQHLPASRSLPTHLPPTPAGGLGLGGVQEPSGWGEPPKGLQINPSAASPTGVRRAGNGKLSSVGWRERYPGASVPSPLLPRPCCLAAGAGLGVILD